VFTKQITRAAFQVGAIINEGGKEINFPLTLALPPWGGGDKGGTPLMLP